MLGAFLILPALFALQSIVADRPGKSFRSAIALGIMALAILLAFSRAAWGGLVIASAFLLALMVLTSPSPAQRSRTSTAVVAVIVVAFLLTVLLSFNSISEMFGSVRALTRSYDEGRFGRFRAAYPGRPRWRSTCRSASARCNSTITFPRTPTTPI